MTEKTIDFKELKKGTEIKSNQLGQEVNGLLLESPKIGKGLKKTVLIYTRASDIGLHDESGSVYSSQITKARINLVDVDGTKKTEWRKVTNAPAQLL